MNYTGNGSVSFQDVVLGLELEIGNILCPPNAFFFCPTKTSLNVLAVKTEELKDKNCSAEIVQLLNPPQIRQWHFFFHLWKNAEVVGCKISIRLTIAEEELILTGCH